MQKTQLINKTLDLHLADVKRKVALKWSSINLCIMSVLIYDTYNMDKSDKFYLIEVVAIAIILISLLKNIFTYLYYTLCNEEITCDNEEQRILLSLNKSNSFVKTAPPKNEALRKQDTNEFAGIRNLSWQSYGEPSSANLSQQTTWMSHNNSLGSFDSTMTHHSDTSYTFASPSKFNKSEFIMDRKRMEEFLHDVSDQEKRIASATEAQSNLSVSTFNSFWGGFDVNGFVSSLKNLTYQLSPHSKQSLRDESFSNEENTAEIIRQMSANKLSNYVTNLKMYIHKTILEPLVHAIDETDKAFEQRGFTDMKIGHVGIERLKKIASSNQQLIQFVPTLPKLLPFLELTTNQEFLVQRIRELAKGSCLKNYKVTSSTYDPSSQMNDHKPNDAGIIFHIFCCYLDSQLQPVPDISRPFYNRYVIIGDSRKTNIDHYVKEAGRNKSKCAILCSNPITPKFNFVTDKIHGSSRHDRNNLFYVIIQLLFHLKSDGNMLETVSLGKSGLNLINVIED